MSAPAFWAAGDLASPLAPAPHFFPDVPPPINLRPALQHLPRDAQKLDWQIQPGIQLWAQEWATERGPLYGVYKDQVLSMTTLFVEDDLMRISWFKDDPADPSVRLELPMYEWIAPMDIPVDHVDVAYTPVARLGHPGLHWEVTAWRIPHAEHAAIARGEKPTLTLREFPPAPPSLPQDATVFSNPIPLLGQHFWDPAVFPFGPFWVAVCGDDARYEVVGVVYMYSQKQMVRTPEGGWEYNNIPMQFTPNHFHFILVPPGFHGYDEPHWDLRVQFTAHETHMEDPRFSPFAFDPCLTLLYDKAPAAVQ
ncbi:MAG: hypothetical protein EXR55_02520 [Dehalococcoidia bacterium]|nr:hypothetical protein [Dehalococcoidia bacterium]